ncbi:unnamed protein product [Staurois parvus]|uniref:Uncharacterized protein n=1 Tax=Staurois parvus TaxID=386267 RepID=A0ABN9G1Q4_9NEOB|nr:unnamed protein product [Staurois parvus]
MDRLAGQRASGHQASGIRSFGSTAGTASSGKAGGTRLGTGTRLNRGIRLKGGCRGTRLNHGRQVLRRQAHRFGYWQDGIGWKEFSLFSGFNYWSTASKRRSANEWSSWRQRRTGGWNRRGSSCYRGLFYRVKGRIGAASGNRGLTCGR